MAVLTKSQLKALSQEELLDYIEKLEILKSWKNQ